MRSHVQGQALATELVQDTRRTYRTFKADIRGTAPPFVPLKDKNSQRLDLNRDVMDLVKVDDEEVEEDNIVFVGVPGTIYLEDVRKRIAMSVSRYEHFWYTRLHLFQGRDARVTQQCTIFCEALLYKLIPEDMPGARAEMCN